MKCVKVYEHGGVDKLVFEECKVPEVLPKTVRVKIYATGINHLDIWVRKGVPGHKFPLPLIPGSDISGVIDAVGEGVTDFKVGDEVVLSPAVSCGHCYYCLNGEHQFCKKYGILGESTDGGYAEYIVVPEANIILKPSHLSFVEAASMPLTFLTAWHMLVTRSKIKPGDTVLIHSAGSGVSTAGIQIAKLFGAVVITTAGSDFKLEMAKKIGADYTINYKTQDFVSEVKKITRKGGVDIVFDHVGKDTFSGNLRVLKRGGRLVTCGTTSGAEVNVNLRLVFFKGISILGSTMGGMGEVLEVFKLIEQKKLKPVVFKTYPLEKVKEAHTLVEGRKQFGKVVLEVKHD